MRILGRDKLAAFWKKRRDAEQPLKSLLAETRNASWSSPGDIRASYPSARTLRGGRIVFKIHGNRYRLIVKVNYAIAVVRIAFIGTHDEYDSIDAENI